MPKLKKQALVTASIPPQINSVTFGLDTNPFASSLLVLDVTYAGSNNKVHISYDPNTTWDGVLKKQLDVTTWLAQVRFTGRATASLGIFSLETLTVTVTSSAGTSNPALVDANIYDST